jgi:excisionase family DNA binding protein
MSGVVVERRTYTVEDAAKLLGISRAAAYAAARTGELPVIPIGGRRLVLKIKLDAMLNGEKQP